MIPRARFGDERGFSDSFLAFFHVGQLVSFTVARRQRTIACLADL